MFPKGSKVIIDQKSVSPLLSCSFNNKVGTIVELYSDTISIVNIEDTTFYVYNSDMKVLDSKITLFKYRG